MQGAPGRPAAVTDGSEGGVTGTAAETDTEVAVVGRGPAGALLARGTDVRGSVDSRKPSAPPRSAAL